MTRFFRALTLLAAVLGVAILTSACGTERVHIPAGTPATQADTSNADYVAAANVFNQRCGGCHTLSYAGTNGSGNNPRTYLDISGPNFNVRCERPAKRVLYAIENGGFGGAYMPANIVVGQQAREVADFVSEFAGREAPQQPNVASCASQNVGQLPALPSLSAAGTSGASGASGTSGSSGSAGTSGTSGSSGSAGTSGTSGASGATSTSGASGASGTTGTGTGTGTSGG